jgi:sodium/proline symporter
MDAYAGLTDPLALAVFVLTLLLPVAVGFVAMRRTRSESDFFVGGRAMGKLVVALSAVSTGRSSWLVLGASGMAYTMGTGAVWAIVGYTVVELFQFIYLGRRLRAESERLGAITVLDYLDARFRDDSKMLRLTGALIIAVFLTAYVAAQFNAGAKALGAALDLPLIPCLLISAALILVYMLLGGYIAVAFNDVVRAVIMLVGLVVLPVAALVKMGGLGTLLEMLRALDPSLIDPFALGAGAMVGFVGIGLGSPGQPHILVRYMSIDDPEKLRESAVVGTVWNVVLGWGAVCIGLIGRALVPELSHLPGSDPEMIYLVLASQHFGALLFGLLVGGVFAAILSTADSQLLVVASTFGRDVYEGVIRRGEEIDEARKLALSRWVVVLSGALALVLAAVAQDLVFWLVLFAWGGLGASFGPVIVLALYWRRSTRWGALAGLITGSVVTIAWRLWLKAPTGLYELIPGIAAALLATVLVSLATRGAPAAGTGDSNRRQGQ